MAAQHSPSTDKVEVILPKATVFQEDYSFSSDFGFSRKLDTCFGGTVQPGEAFLPCNCVLYIVAYLCGPGTNSSHPSFLLFSSCTGELFKSSNTRQHTDSFITTDKLDVEKGIKKGKVHLVQALRLCTGCTAQRGSRSIALLFLDHGTREG